MADETVTPSNYQPGRTLGRSGYDTPPLDAMSMKVAQLDALMVLITIDDDGEDGSDFSRLNKSIQSKVLELASDLATEVHELFVRHTEEQFAKGQL